MPRKGPTTPPACVCLEMTHQFDSIAATIEQTERIEYPAENGAKIILLSDDAARHLSDFLRMAAAQCREQCALAPPPKPAPNNG